MARTKLVDVGHRGPVQAGHRWRDAITRLGLGPAYGGTRQRGSVRCLVDRSGVRDRILLCSGGADAIPASASVLSLLASLR